LAGHIPRKGLARYARSREKMKIKFFPAPRAARAHHQENKFFSVHTATARARGRPRGQRLFFQKLQTHLKLTI